MSASVTNEKLAECASNFQTPPFSLSFTVFNQVGQEEEEEEERGGASGLLPRHDTRLRVENARILEFY
jgi:hypothetical protein